MAGFPDPSRLGPAWLEPHQARRRPPTDYENMLGDALEAAFAAGAWELDQLVARLNADAIRMPDGSEFTVQSFERLMADLGKGYSHE
jgi:hypothetical protein